MAVQMTRDQRKAWLDMMKRRVAWKHGRAVEVGVTHRCCCCKEYRDESAMMVLESAWDLEGNPAWVCFECGIIVPRSDVD